MRSKGESWTGPRLIYSRYNLFENIWNLDDKNNEFEKSYQKPFSIQFNQIVNTFHPCLKMSTFISFCVPVHLLVYIYDFGFILYVSHGFPDQFFVLTFSDESSKILALCV